MTHIKGGGWGDKRELNFRTAEFTERTLDVQVVRQCPCAVLHAGKMK